MYLSIKGCMFGVVSSLVPMADPATVERESEHKLYKDVEEEVQQ